MDAIESLPDPVATRRLELAIALAVSEAVIQIVLLIGRGVWSGAPLRIAFLAAKLPFCFFALRRRPGAYLAVWLYEFAGIVAGLTVHAAGGTRLATAAGALVVSVFLGRAVSAFPPVEWKPR